MTDTPTTCRDCGRASATWYWYNAKGQSLNQPRCPECHAQQIRREVREKVDDKPVGSRSGRVLVDLIVALAAAAVAWYTLVWGGMQ